jgi:hypothetical protein
MPEKYTVSDASFGLYGPFPTLGEARKCARDLSGWVITETESGLVIDSAERGYAEHTD